MDRRLVDHFVNSELISRAGMQRIILRATKNKSRVLEELLAAETIAEELIAAGVASCYGFEVLDTSNFDANEIASKMITGPVAEKHGVLPFAMSDSGDRVSIAIFDNDLAEDLLKTLQMATGNEPRVFVGPRTFVVGAIRHYYFGDAWVEKPGPVKIDLSEVMDDIDVNDLVAPPEAPRNEARASAQKAAPKAKPPTRRPSPPIVLPDKGSSVSAALNDFDDFLENTDYVSGAPGINRDPLQSDWNHDHMAGGSSFGGMNAFDGSGFGSHEDRSFDEDAFSGGASGFDLFEPSEATMPLDEQIRRHEHTIERLSKELKGQREVVSSLIDLLVESRVISRKELMKRVKAKRQS